MQVKQRSIAVAIILTIITCGIYGLYWLVVMQDELNEITDDKNNTSGALVLIFSLITCGIYSWYWLFKSGEKVDALKQARGESYSYMSIVFLVLGLLGFSIIAYALIQDEINKYARKSIQ